MMGGYNHYMHSDGHYNKETDMIPTTDVEIPTIVFPFRYGISICQSVGRSVRKTKSSYEVVTEFQ
jgi:hypothetical protein